MIEYYSLQCFDDITSSKQKQLQLERERECKRGEEIETTLVWVEFPVIQHIRH